MDSRQRIEEKSFLRLRYADLPLDAALDRILDASRSDRLRYVVTPNAYHAVAYLERRAEVGPLFENAWLRLCDSRVLAMLAKRLQGLELPVVTGSDLTPALLRRARDLGLKVALVGSRAEDAARLRARYAGLDLAHFEPAMDLRRSARSRRACLDFISRERPQVTLLAVGMPQQEMIALEAQRAQATGGVALCVGAAVDFLVGKEKRAPLWMQRGGLEWLHRLLRNPRRLSRRYFLVCPRILFHAVRETARRREAPLGRPKAASQPAEQPAE